MQVVVFMKRYKTLIMS